MYKSISKDFIINLLDQIDIVELISEYLMLKQIGNSFVTICPFHQEKTPSFYVVKNKKFYYCFGCHNGGNAINFIMQYLNKNFVDSVNILSIKIGKKFINKNNNNFYFVSDLYNTLEIISNFYKYELLNNKNGETAIQYLKNRGIDKKTINLYKIGFSPKNKDLINKYLKIYKRELFDTGILIKKNNEIYDRYQNRIVFPIYNHIGKVIGFGGRSIDNIKPKYINSPETVLFKKGQTLYGLYQAIQEKIDYILIVEGYIDVIMLSQHGIKNSISILGTSISHYHLQFLKKYTKELFFCFDGDEAGTRSYYNILLKCLPHINNNLNINFVFLPKNEDPDSIICKYGKNKFMHYINYAKPFNKYLFDILLNNKSVICISKKHRVIYKIQQYISMIKDNIYKKLLIEELSEKIQVNYLLLYQLTNYTNHIDIIRNEKILYSPIQILIAILIQFPNIINEIPINYNDSIFKHHKILELLIQTLHENPKINTIQLVESWKDTKYFKTLLQLSIVDLNMSKQNIIKEFSSIVSFLKKQQLEQKINNYIIKYKNIGLTKSEKSLLYMMIKKKYKILF